MCLCGFKSRDCQQFLGLCQQFIPTNIQVLGTESATIANRKRQTIGTAYTIAVINPTVNSIISGTIFPSRILQQVLNNNKAQFLNGTGLTILSIADNNIFNGLPFNLEILATIVLPVVVVIMVLILVSGTIIIIVVA